MSNETNKETTGVHGYKVFRPDWSCDPINGNTKQYTCPGKFEEEGEIEVCGHGMHFCRKAAACFNYYDFTPGNKVAEVIAYGRVVTKGDKSCTDKLEIVRELTWEEVLKVVNTGEDCTGLCNTGDNNTGDYNTGYGNTGNWNSGDCNTGNENAGNCNTGNWNIGNCNEGHSNTGSYNVYDCNAGNWNEGNGNAGNYNAGHHNTGDCNTGDWNTGCYNKGDENTGDWNKSSHNTGCFMTEEQPIMFFNKPSDWTYEDWSCSEAKAILGNMPQYSVLWIQSNEMTEKEKEAHPTYNTVGGYLKVLNRAEIRRKKQNWWECLSDEAKATVKSIPNFDPGIFYQCTGIKVE